MSTPAEEPKVESRTGVVRYDELFNQRTLQTILRKTATDDQERKVNRKKPVVVVRRVINQKGQLEKTCYDIKTERLREVFRDIYKNAYNFQLSEARQEVSLENLFHARTELAIRLEEELKKNPKSEHAFELQTILDVVRLDLHEENQDQSQIELEGRVSFPSLWMIFPPGTLVYRLHPMLQQHQVMRLLSCRYTKDRDSRPMFVLNCDVVQDDGRSFGLSSGIIEIKDFPEATTIQDLAAYPLQLHPDAAKIREHCIARGKNIAPLRQGLFHTRGIAYKRKWGERWGEIKEDRFSAYGRVMIDAKTFRNFQPNDPIVVSVRRALDDSNGLAEDDYLICSPVLLGYCFGTKQWGGFAWENLSNVTWSEDAFSQLVLDPHQKRLVHALVHQHSEEAKASFDDIIAGKGKGIIGLLSGNPGCGKTLTAEAVAEVTRRPLYAVSAGELGIEADTVDKKLTSIFELAQTWRVVVLLDEADVFLYKRTANRLEQNALVAIFLRHLEYFEGIMILTTNMVEDFDMAFESRIHFSIRYPDLGYESRKAIWKTFLTKGMNAKDGAGPDQATIERLARYHSLNGRQIKNTVSVAMSLAAEDKVPLSIEHIITVLETRKLWDDVKEGKTREPDDDVFFEAVKAEENTKQEPESKQTPVVARSKLKEFKAWTDQLLPFFTILMMPVILLIALCLRS